MREAGEISHQKINEKIGPPRGGKLNRALETLTAVLGRKPVGYRAPSWQFSPYTMQQVDAGFLYDSSLMASDGACEILLEGEPTPHRGPADRTHCTTFPTSAAQPTAGFPIPMPSSAYSSRSSTSHTRKAACSF